MSENQELNITAALSILAERGIIIKAGTLRFHCKAGNLKARNTNPTNPRRGEWLIDKTTLENWQPGHAGNPGTPRASYCKGPVESGLGDAEWHCMKCGATGLWSKGTKHK